MALIIKRVAVAVSTNDLIKRAVEKDGDISKLIIADRQTGGRGRRGNSFFSPKGGTYFSFAVPYPENDPTLTAAAGVAACRVLRSRGISAGIKWVNDIYVDGRKAGGILCEKATGPDGAVYAVIGIGLNTGKARFPSELTDVACSIDAYMPPASLASAISDEFFEIRRYGLDIGEYEALSVLIGRDVRWTENGVEKTGRATGVDEQCGLAVKTASGVAVLRSGEVNTVRPIGEDIDKQAGFV